MHPSLVRDGQSMKGHAFTQFLPEKAQGTRKDQFTSSLEPTQILAFFSATLVFFFSSLYCLLTSALLRGYMLTHRTGAQAEMNMMEHFYPNKHEDLKMYRCHWWTMAKGFTMKTWWTYGAPSCRTLVFKCIIMFCMHFHIWEKNHVIYFFCRAWLFCWLLMFTIEFIGCFDPPHLY